MKNKIKNNSTYKHSDIEVLDRDFIDISDKSVREYDLTTVRGSVRLRTAEFITEQKVSQLKREVRSLRFPSKK